MLDYFFLEKRYYIVFISYLLMSNLTKVSFAKAQSVLKKFRYKPRREWSDEERILFKLCNFAVLSKKRLNAVLVSIQKLSKLSDKSHYKYTGLDIKLIKELILESLSLCFEKFKQKVSIIKESDIEKINNHLEKLKNENTRLENEITRLNFLVENFIREKEILDIEELREILNKKSSKKRKKVNKQLKGLEKLEFKKENIKDFLEKWNQGYTTFEITESFKKIEMDIKGSKKKTFKL